MSPLITRTLLYVYSYSILSSRQASNKEWYAAGGEHVRSFPTEILYIYSYGIDHRTHEAMGTAHIC